LAIIAQLTKAAPELRILQSHNFGWRAYLSANQRHQQTNNRADMYGLSAIELQPSSQADHDQDEQCLANTRRKIWQKINATVRTAIITLQVSETR
jgi:hypothetical protein